MIARVWGITRWVSGCLFGNIMVLGFVLVLFAGLLFFYGQDIALFIPGKLGLVDHASPRENITVRGSGNQELLFTRSGLYRIYAGRFLSGMSVTFTSHDTGEVTTARKVRYPTGTEMTISVPQYVFEIDRGGMYTATVEGQDDDSSFIIARYVENQNATAAVLLGLAQIGIVATVGRLFYRFGTRGRRKSHEADQKVRHDQMAGFLDHLESKRRTQSEIRKHSDETE